MMPEAHHFKKDVARVNGVRIHYVTAGEGEPLVLLHGWPQTWYSWRKVVPYLVNHFQIIAPDLRGFGDSEKPSSGFDKKTVAEDIYQLTKSLGIESFYLAGHDLGATAAYPLTMLHSSAVKKVAFLDVAPLGVADDPLSSTPWHFGFHMISDLPEALTAGREAEYLKYWYRAAYPIHIDDTDVEEYIRCFSATGAMRAGFDHYRAFPQDIVDNNKFAQQKMQTPTLCIGAENSFGEHAFRVMSQAATNVQSVVIKGASHWMIEEKPEEIAQTLLKFFKGDST